MRNLLIATFLLKNVIEYNLIMKLVTKSTFDDYYLTGWAESSAKYFNIFYKKDHCSKFFTFHCVFIFTLKVIYLKN